VACSILLLLHHNALAAVGEGNEGGSGGRESTFFLSLEGASEEIGQ
jgi:hypothetical protein